MAMVRRIRQRGYSLIEMLTATAILAAVLAIGIPNLMDLGSPYALNSAVSQVAADLHDARMRAIARNCSYRVNIDPTAGTWVLERETVPGSGTFVADSRRQELPRGAEFGSVTADPVFTSQGMLQQQVTIPVSVTGKNYTGTKTVTINVLGHTTIS